MDNDSDPYNRIKRIYTEYKTLVERDTERLREREFICPERYKQELNNNETQWQVARGSINAIKSGRMPI